MTIVLIIIGILVALSIAINAIWILFPAIFAGAIFFILKTFAEHGAAKGNTLAKLFSDLCDGYIGVAFYIVILGCIVLL